MRPPVDRIAHGPHATAEEIATCPWCERNRRALELAATGPGSPGGTLAILRSIAAGVERLEARQLALERRLAMRG